MINYLHFKGFPGVQLNLERREMSTNLSLSNEMLLIVVA